MNSRARLDGLLLFEVVMVLVVAVAGVLLFWRPAAMGFTDPRWWHWLVLGALFFLLLALHGWRSGRLRHRALHESIRRAGGPGSRLE